MGIKDICIAYPVFGESKWERMAALAAQGVRITVNCDNEDAARGLSKAAINAGAAIKVQIDLDTGMHRGGVPSSDIRSIKHLARTLAELPGLEFDGITTYRSLSYEGAPSPADAGYDEGRIMVQVAERLTPRGIEVRKVSEAARPPPSTWRKCQASRKLEPALTSLTT